MNLCLRTNGRKKCAEIADQAITVLSSLLTHPNHEVYFQLIYKNLLNYFSKYFQTRPYVNSSLYSILTLQSIRDQAIQLVSNEFSLDFITIFIF